MNKQAYIKLNTKYLILLTLFLAAFSERVAYNLGPNIELITMAMILVSHYFGKKESFWLTFLIIATTDRLIGNSNIFLFTWSGFLIPAFLANRVLKKLTINNRQLTTKKIFDAFSLTSVGISSNIFFYLWTNFGVWFLGNMYSKNLAGLLLSYFYAIPFFKNQLTSTIIFVPLGYAVIEITLYFLKKINPASGLVQKSLL